MTPEHVFVRAPKQHRYPPYEHDFDDLCDRGCGRPVPDGGDARLRRFGWVITPNAEYLDGKERTCPVCVDARRLEEFGPEPPYGPGYPDGDDA